MPQVLDKSTLKQIREKLINVHFNVALAVTANQACVKTSQSHFDLLPEKFSEKAKYFIMRNRVKLR